MTAQAVIQAIHKGDVQSLQRLLEADPKLASARDANGVSAIMHALYTGKKELVNQLLATNPKLAVAEAVALGNEKRLLELIEETPTLVKEYWSPDGFTCLHLACFFGQKFIVDILLEKGAFVNVESRNQMKVTPLHSAASARDFDIVRVLLEHGAHPNARQHGGWTALQSAAMHGDQAMVKLLIKHGAKVNLQSDDGSTAEQLARKNGHEDVAQLLVFAYPKSVTNGVT
jgi:ankyrin repeat protein